MKTNVYKIEMLVIDHECMSEGSVRFQIQDQDWASKVMKLEKREVEWDDAHPLNHADTQEAEYRRLFGGDE